MVQNFSLRRDVHPCILGWAEIWAQYLLGNKVYGPNYRKKKYIQFEQKTPIIGLEISFSRGTIVEAMKLFFYTL
jgi:hypothetical protein